MAKNKMTNFHLSKMKISLSLFNIEVFSEQKKETMN